MAALRSSLKLSRIIGTACRQQRHISSSRVLLYEWNYKWEPGQYPTTKEERDAAAKKYEMLPEDYKPIPDEDGFGWGDYPDIPVYNQAEKDPNEVYDDPYTMTNYGEPLNIYFDVYTADKVSAKKDIPDHSVPFMVSCYLAVVLGFMLIAYKSLTSTMMLGGQGSGVWMCKKQYPWDVKNEHLFGRPGSQQRQVHYTFEQPAQD